MAAAGAPERMAEPYVRFCLGKYVDKGEDAWLEKPANTTKPVTTEQGPRLAGPAFRAAAPAASGVWQDSEQLQDVVERRQDSAGRQVAAAGWQGMDARACDAVN